MSEMDWSKYPNFSREEFECSATGYCDMNADFMEQIQILREVYGRPMVVTSGYRDPIEHPIEANKTRPALIHMGWPRTLKYRMVMRMSS